MELVQTVLPLLALLACPLMMGFCVFGMRRMGSVAPPTESSGASQLPEERIVVLQQQLQAIQAELTTLQPVLAPTPDDRSVDGNDWPLEVIPGTAYATRRPT